MRLPSLCFFLSRNSNRQRVSKTCPAGFANDVIAKEKKKIARTVRTHWHTPCPRRRDVGLPGRLTRLSSRLGSGRFHSHTGGRRLQSPIRLEARSHVPGVVSTPASQSVSQSRVLVQRAGNEDDAAETEVVLVSLRGPCIVLWKAFQNGFLIGMRNEQQQED